MIKDHKILVTLDVSYFSYYCLFGAVKIWKATSPHSHILKPAKDTDQDNVPDLTKYPDFCNILQKQVLKRLDTMMWCLKSNAQQDLDLATQVDIFFCLDAPIKGNWRRKIFPQYKAQRKLAPKQLNTYACINHIINVIFKKIDLEEKYGCQIIKADNAEGDDIISILMQKLTGYDRKIIIASDKDFLQLEDVTMIDMAGKVKTIYPKHTHSITPRLYRIAKALQGDISDSIPPAFGRCGEKTAIKLTEDIPLLKKKLHDNPIAAEQFMLNKQIIDFENIPQELVDDVLSKVKVKQRLDEEIDLSDLMQL